MSIPGTVGSFTLKRKCFMDEAVLVLGERGGTVEEDGGPDHSKTASNRPDIHVIIGVCTIIYTGKLLEFNVNFLRG